MRFTKILFVASVLLVSTTAYADDDARLLAKSKVSLSDAVKTAEQHTGGKAYHAELDDFRDKPVVEVDVRKGKGTIEVRVDALTGKVLKSKKDDDDDGAFHKLGLADLITRAEAHTKARAYKADCDDDERTCEIELLDANGQELEVKIVGDTGEVVRVKVDD